MWDRVLSQFTFIPYYISIMYINWVRAVQSATSQDQLNIFLHCKLQYFSMIWHVGAVMFREHPMFFASYITDGWRPECILLPFQWDCKWHVKPQWWSWFCLLQIYNVAVLQRCFEFQWPYNAPLCGWKSPIYMIEQCVCCCWASWMCQLDKTILCRLR